LKSKNRAHSFRDSDGHDFTEAHALTSGLSVMPTMPRPEAANLSEAGASYNIAKMNRVSSVKNWASLIVLFINA